MHMLMFMLMFMFIMLLFKMSYLNILIITRFMVIMVATMIGMGAIVTTTDNITQIAKSFSWTTTNASTSNLILI